MLNYCNCFYVGTDPNAAQPSDSNTAGTGQSNDPNAAILQNGKKEGGLVQQVPPGKQVPKKLPSLSSPPRSRLVPVAKPLGIDPVEILKEREFR